MCWVNLVVEDLFGFGWYLCCYYNRFLILVYIMNGILSWLDILVYLSYFFFFEVFRFFECCVYDNMVYVLLGDYFLWLYDGRNENKSMVVVNILNIFVSVLKFLME